MGMFTMSRCTDQVQRRSGHPLDGTRSVLRSANLQPQQPTVSKALAPRPPLKWAGGKRWQVRHLIEVWRAESHRRLVEPFCGGLAVTLGLLPDRALLNDINPPLINFYRWLKQGLVITLSMTNAKTRLLRAPEAVQQATCGRASRYGRSASLFYYLNRTGYNGLCRFNSRGGFNVPFGKYKNINYRTDFLEYKSIFAKWKLANTHFEALELRDDDFVYADPPYDVEFTQYSRGGFGWDEQLRTAEWLSKHEGPVILSNQATDRIVKLYESLKFRLKFLDAPRRISCNGDRTPAPEVLAFRNLK